MRIIVLFRHLPTKDDISNIYTSHNSQVQFAPFKTELIQNAEDQLCEFLETHKIKQVFCSDNYRGIETAKILLKNISNKIEIGIEGGLNNINQPEWGGMNQKEVRNTEKYKIWHSEPKMVKFINGESLSDVEERVTNVLKKIDSKGALLISHTTPLQVIICKLLKIDLNRIWAFKFDHYSFSVIVNDILIKYNTEIISKLNLNELRL